jgi:ABC-2 type transport system ATP-binding protein
MCIVKENPMIEVEHVTKHYGDKAAVSDLTFSVAPGIVTGFLGPNGAGKSTTMRVILGLDRADSGRATVNGKPYVDLPAPLREVGALLEARAIHTGRSAYNHLLAMAQTHGIPRSRVQEVVDLVGLTEVARQRAGGFSLGMGQRLGVAAALLGDPSVLILDEPANGLDPEGILWMRNLLKSLAAEGRTVFLSSHLMAEMAQTAEHVVVIGRGRLIADTTVSELVAQASRDSAVRVRSPDADELRSALAGDGVTILSPEPGVLEVHGLASAQIGSVAARRGLELHELIPQTASLEQAFIGLTDDAVEYQGAQSPEREEQAA